MQKYDRLGSVDLDTVEKVEITIREEDKIRQERFGLRPSLSEILNLHDFEVYCLTHYASHECLISCRLSQSW